MEHVRAFLKRKNIVISAKRYGVDALGAMAQGLFCTLLVGTILNTLGTQFHIGFLSATVLTVGSGDAATAYTVGGLASAMVGPAMAVAIGYALQAPPLVLFSLTAVGTAANSLGGGGGPGLSDRPAPRRAGGPHPGPPGGRPHQLRPRPPEHPHPVQPGRAAGLGGRPAGVPHPGRQGGGAAGAHTPLRRGAAGAAAGPGGGRAAAGPPAPGVGPPGKNSCNLPRQRV